MDQLIVFAPCLPRARGWTLARVKESSSIEPHLVPPRCGWTLKTTRRGKVRCTASPALSPPVINRFAQSTNPFPHAPFPVRDKARESASAAFGLTLCTLVRPFIFGPCLNSGFPRATKAEVPPVKGSTSARAKSQRYVPVAFRWQARRVTIPQPCGQTFGHRTPAPSRSSRSAHACGYDSPVAAQAPRTAGARVAIQSGAACQADTCGKGAEPCTIWFPSSSASAADRPNGWGGNRPWPFTLYRELIPHARAGNTKHHNI